MLASISTVPPIPGSALPTQFLGEHQEKHEGGNDCRDSAGKLGLIAENKYKERFRTAISFAGKLGLIAENKY